jgi:hypothetical protein
MEIESTRKLRILCLHGFNNNIESFTYMTEGIRLLLKDVATFHFIDG